MGYRSFLTNAGAAGGIWFDKNELFRAKQGMARKVDRLVDGKKLRNLTSLDNKILYCPRDGKRLKLLSDRYFPNTTQVEVCPNCGGLWFNRGEFIGFQKERKGRELKRREKAKKESEARFSKELSSRINATLKLYNKTEKEQEKKKKEDMAGMIFYLLWVLFRYLLRG